MKWLPAAVLGALIILGITAGTLFELPTIDQKWGSPEQIENAGLFEMSGLKNIKCFGSSTAFANQMRQVEGVYGVSTYVASHTVHILYDTVMYDDMKLQQLLFVPVKKTIEPVAGDVNEVSCYTLTLDKFFDPLDAIYLQHLLDQNTDACGYQSEFACPVIVRIYFPAGSEPDRETLTRVLESKKLSFTSAGNEFNVRLPYRVVTFSEPALKISKQEYIRQMFTPTSSVFNGFSGYSSDALSGYILPAGANAEHKARYSYLISHLSNDSGVVGFETSLSTDDEELVTVWYVDSLTTPENIFGHLNTDTLLFHYSDGSIGKVANPFRFPEPGKITRSESH
jgi:hypothetical protein